VRQLIRIATACILSLYCLSAAEYRGLVTYGGLPLPGATVTATLGDRKAVAVTDEQGVYSFADLADGRWNIQVEMLCFAPMQREVAVAANAPADAWEMKLLPVAEIRASAVKPAAMPSPSVAENQPAQPGQTNPPANGKKGAAAPQAQPSGFQRAEVNASGNAASAAPDEDAALPTADVTQKATDGFLINGTSNNAATSPFSLNPAFGNSRRGPRSLYNGSLGFNMDNSVLDARSFSLTGQDTPKPSYNRFTGLASFGGPLRIPGLLRNGPNIFVNYQWTRNRTATTTP